MSTLRRYTRRKADDVALVLVGIIHIGDEQDGLAGIAVAGVRDGLQAELFGFKGLGAHSAMASPWPSANAFMASDAACRRC